MVPKRILSVRCVSTKGICYRMTKEAFQESVNQFRFHDAILNEMHLKLTLYKERVQQTHVFQHKFLLSQHQKLYSIDARSRHLEQQSRKHNSERHTVSPTNKTDNSDEIATNSSRLELSSIFDCNDLNGADFEPLFPRKKESEAVQKFKILMLEAAIKPKTLRNY